MSASRRSRAAGGAGGQPAINPPRSGVFAASEQLEYSAQSPCQRQADGCQASDVRDVTTAVDGIISGNDDDEDLS